MRLRVVSARDTNDTTDTEYAGVEKSIQRRRDLLRSRGLDWSTLISTETGFSVIPLVGLNPNFVRVLSPVMKTKEEHAGVAVTTFCLSHSLSSCSRDVRSYGSHHWRSLQSRCVSLCIIVSYLLTTHPRLAHMNEYCHGLGIRTEFLEYVTDHMTDHMVTQI